MTNYDDTNVSDAYAQHRTVHPRVMEKLLPAEPLMPEHRVLEIGCGTGNYIRALAARTGCRAYGLEAVASMLAHISEQTPIWRIQGRAEALPIRPGAMNLAFSVDVIHHVADKSAYLHEAWSALKPGGLCCIVTDSAWIIRHRVPLSTFFPETVPLELARYPRIPDLIAVMADCGFVDLRKEMVSYHYPLTDVGPYRTKSFSALRLLPDAAFCRGLKRLEAALALGPIPAVSRYTMLWGTKAS